MTRFGKSKVYLIGAGPGDPNLITVRGQKLLTLADVVVYDHLANDSLLAYVSPECEKIYVGKQAGMHTMDQSAINELLVNKAREGCAVVRLKGGDPFVFGRGGEEAAFLKENGIPFEIVPGVTSATAALAYAGIPLTHRGLASSASIITGHEDPEKEGSDIEWKALAGMHGTLVFFMGIRELSKIASKLMENGMPDDTPAAVIRLGTLPEQQTVTGTLKDIAQRADYEKILPPGLIVVGSVVKMRDELKWYEYLPLFGKKIVITRSAEQTREFSERLSALGAAVINRPAIEIVPPESYMEFDSCLRNGAEYDWVIFTSVNGVRAFSKRMFELELDIRTFGRTRFAAIGNMSGIAVRQLGVTVDFIPGKYTSDDFALEFRKKYTDIKGKKILIPSSNIAGDIIPDELRRFGAEVTCVTAYRTVLPRLSAEESAIYFGYDEADLVTFTSSSTVDNFFSIIPEGESGTVRKKLKAASIGPMTSATLREHGVEPVIEAEVHTIDGLILALTEYYGYGK